MKNDRRDCCKPAAPVCQHVSWIIKYSEVIHAIHCAPVPLPSILPVGRGTKAGNANTRYLPTPQLGHRNVNSSQREIKCHADAPSNRENGFLSPTVFFFSTIVRLLSSGTTRGGWPRLIVFLSGEKDFLSVSISTKKIRVLIIKVVEWVFGIVEIFGLRNYNSDMMDVIII